MKLKDRQKMENKLVKYSRAGDVFHYRWPHAVALDLYILNHHSNVSLLKVPRKASQPESM